MPCSRIEAPLAQCAPRLIGESNTGSWRIHTPFSHDGVDRAADRAVRADGALHFSTFGDRLLGASALPIVLNGNWLAKAPAPAPCPSA